MATSVVRARLAATVSLVALSLATPTLAQSAQEQAATTIDDIIVTAQKREESIQSVPIAVSAFNAETLDALKIEGGSELLRAIPNVAFSKNNFSMFNFAIRGVGTKAISAGSDPAVAISFNNSPMIRNRLFESEYMDVSRVEVLRGPQGTLYGRNATAGVVNMVPNLPGPDFSALIKGETGSYGTLRGQGMINIPLSDQFAVRGAASFTKRDGFDRNTYRETDINNRDLWSVRLSAAWEPNDRFSANFIWERFSEDDKRSRTGKQLCATDPGPTKVGAASVSGIPQTRLTQGCLPVSLYDEASYGTPNGSALAILYPTNLFVGYRDGVAVSATNVDVERNIYKGVAQSKDLREYSSYFDPKFYAKNDVFQLNLSYDISDSITLHSQTLYTSDSYRASQDYNRYLSNVIFNDISNIANGMGNPIPDDHNKNFVSGQYFDPQLGWSDRMISLDLSQSENSQFSTELRLQSSFDGPFNFSLGANYLKFKTEDNYYVFNNLFNFAAEYFYNTASDAFKLGLYTVNCVDPIPKECIGIDRSSLSDLNGDGHNYFRSKNVVNTESYSAFGELYYNVFDRSKLTFGLRYTNDNKISTPYPSQLLLGKDADGSSGDNSGGYVSWGYPAMDDVKQSWEAVTGRLVYDFKPTDQSMVFASYARGYKGGGVNPPRADLDPTVVQYQPLQDLFEPEYVDAFELGFKAKFHDDRIRLNGSLFFSDYKDYQVSQIVDRIALNENFDATTYGAELEGVWQASSRLRFDFTLGILKTRIGDGEESIDVMNRTQGDTNWTLVRPWIQVPSNCIAPTNLVEKILQNPFSMLYGVQAFSALCAGSKRWGTFTSDISALVPLSALFQINYNPLTDAPNYGRGIMDDLSGNELPNAPRYTANLGVSYEIPISSGEFVFRSNYYRQSESYFRVYNTDYDKLKSWGSLNVSVSYRNMARDFDFEFYVKNVFDDAPIVDAFTNSDDSLLSTNVFTLDPRVVGFSVSRRF